MAKQDKDMLKSANDYFNENIAEKGSVLSEQQQKEKDETQVDVNDMIKQGSKYLYL
tara:strand:+ start:22957 stop:23124 length:168 start_codon:yes stop_codon:yes gene_type:complete